VKEVPFTTEPEIGYTFTMTTPRTEQAAHSGEAGVRPPAAAIELSNVTVAPNGLTILESFSLRVEAGERVILTGPSGSGKTTVLRCLAGLVVPSSGTITIGGVRMDDSTVWDLRARLAYVPQEPDLGTGTVRQWIERPFSYQANTDRKKNLAGLDDLFKCFQLDRSLLESDISTISGGEKQRVALVSAITLDRTIYLLDEPASALDERNTEILMDYFRARDDLCVVAAAHAAGNLPFAHRVVTLAGLGLEVTG
jgi:ABC-type iron transport system FetAB ATPase subunit